MADERNYEYPPPNFNSGTASSTSRAVSEDASYSATDYTWFPDTFSYERWNMLCDKGGHKLVVCGDAQNRSNPCQLAMSSISVDEAMQTTSGGAIEAPPDFLGTDVRIPDANWSGQSGMINYEDYGTVVTYVPCDAVPHTRHAGVVAASPMGNGASAKTPSTRRVQARMNANLEVVEGGAADSADTLGDLAREPRIHPRDTLPRVLAKAGNSKQLPLETTCAHRS